MLVLLVLEQLVLELRLQRGPAQMLDAAATLRASKGMCVGLTLSQCSSEGFTSISSHCSILGGHKVMAYPCTSAGTAGAGKAAGTAGAVPKAEYRSACIARSSGVTRSWRILARVLEQLVLKQRLRRFPQIWKHICAQKQQIYR